VGQSAADEDVAGEDVAGDDVAGDDAAGEVGPGEDVAGEDTGVDGGVANEVQPATAASSAAQAAAAGHRQRGAGLEAGSVVSPAYYRRAGPGGRGVGTHQSPFGPKRTNPPRARRATGRRSG
jgi:hypothetical protein